MKSPFLHYIYFSVLLLLLSCVDAVEPEFDFKDNLIFVDAYALTEEGLSTISVRRSVFLNDRFYTEGIENADIKLLNTDSGLEVICTEDTDGIYVPPSDFKVEAGETWKLVVDLEDGRSFESTPETVIGAVEVDKLESTYFSDLVYSEAERRFVPGHKVNISWNDPAGEKNYYLWKYRTFEPILICKTCERGRYRNGECLEESQFRFRNFDYLCDDPCWLIRTSETVQILEDRLIDGSRVEQRPIADVPFYRNQDILVEIQQLSLTESSYEYFNIINDILVESSGLNAPPPAALIGNLFSTSDPDEVILGQFTATASSTLNLFIDRSDLPDPALFPGTGFSLEDQDSPTSIISLPCVEGALRTSVKPEGWK